MTLKHLFTAAAIAAITFTAAAQDSKAFPKRDRDAKFSRMPVSAEAKAKIDNIKKEELAKVQAKMENMKKLADAYKANKTDENKAKLMDEINKGIDENIAVLESKIAKMKADKANAAEKIFKKLTNESKPQHRGKGNRKPRGNREKPAEKK